MVKDNRKTLDLTRVKSNWRDFTCPRVYIFFFGRELIFGTCSELMWSDDWIPRSDGRQLVVCTSLHFHFHVWLAIVWHPSYSGTVLTWPTDSVKCITACDSTIHRFIINFWFLHIVISFWSYFRTVNIVFDYTEKNWVPRRKQRHYISSCIRWNSIWIILGLL